MLTDVFTTTLFTIGAIQPSCIGVVRRIPSETLVASSLGVRRPRKARSRGCPSLVRYSGVFTMVECVTVTGSAYPNRGPKNRSSRTVVLTSTSSSATFDAASPSCRKFGSRCETFAWNDPRSESRSSPTCPAYPGVFTLFASRMSSTHTSSVSPGMMRVAPSPELSTRMMPTASSCTARRFGALTPGSTVYTM